MVFDFAQLADGILRNNLGLGGFFLEALVDRTEGRVRVVGTGQELALKGSWPNVAEAPSWQRLRVVKWAKGQPTEVEWVRAAQPFEPSDGPVRPP
jgi:hypothetical protein